MQLDWNTIIVIASLANLFVYAEPTIMLRRYLGFKDEEMMSYSSPKQFIHKLINCSMCLAFWLGAFTLDLSIMALAAIVANAIEKWIILK